MPERQHDPIDARDKYCRGEAIKKHRERIEHYQKKLEEIQEINNVRIPRKPDHGADERTVNEQKIIDKIEKRKEKINKTLRG